MASNGYKEMISKAQMGDILLTDKVTGINANFIRQSLEQAGMNPDELAPHGDMDIDKELSEAHDPKQNSAKPWRDLWSAGHGVGQITSSPSVAKLVSQLRVEFHAANTAQFEDSQKYVRKNV
jgi:nitronate monooxygenase